jgi:hypothetical protein
MSIQRNINTLLGIAGGAKIAKKEETTEKVKPTEDKPKPPTHPAPSPEQEQVIVPEDFYQQPVQSLEQASTVATNTANEIIQSKQKQKTRLKTRLQLAKEKQKQRHLKHAEMVVKEKEERDERRGK